MKFWRTARREIMTISITPADLTCSWVNRNELGQCILKAHQQWHLPIELTHLKIFNVTTIKKHLRAFITEHKLTDASAVISLRGPTVHEGIIQLPTASPTQHDFRAGMLKKLTWDFVYLYPDQEGSFAFYVAGISQQVLFQFKLLLLTLSLKTHALVPELCAYMQLYKYCYGVAFRAAQLAQDMRHHNNNYTQLITPDLLHRTMHIPSTLAANHTTQDITRALGLYLIGDQ